MAKGYWIAHVDVSDPEATKSILPPMALLSPNSAGGFWCAAAP